MDTCFIHVADPGFPDPPWRGVRRLGPFNSTDEALAQAAADAAAGHGLALGVFPDTAKELQDAQTEHEESQVDNVDPQPFVEPELVPLVTAKQIQAEADKLTTDILATQMLEREENDAALNSVLKGGVTAAELREKGLIP